MIARPNLLKKGHTSQVKS